MDTITLSRRGSDGKTLGTAELYALCMVRLPCGRWPMLANGQPTRFTIVPRRGHTTGIPLSHTCFFTIELPEYVDYDTCKRMLILACSYGASEACLIA